VEVRLIEKDFTVAHCPQCDCHALVPTGETWQHDCPQGHQLLWLSATEAACTSCEWMKTRPRVDGRWQSGHTVKAIHSAAHAHKPSQCLSGKG
jgi:hypothetical protein